MPRRPHTTMAYEGNAIAHNTYNTSFQKGNTQRRRPSALTAPNDLYEPLRTHRTNNPSKAPLRKTSRTARHYL